ncbi:MAG: NYN domain-containing protein [Candidatus Promineifilaceae bacterium]|nr:NYN domain-containing protein [Candidatus Promineifilaceae bacterium]
MHYLIDGHNLIGKLDHISLDEPDDEVKLILLLRSWTAARRKRRVTVIFDHGLPGGVEKGLSSGTVKVIFASTGSSADALLMKRIRQVRNPEEYTLVTSDLKIIRAAEARRMPVQRSEQFAQELYSDRGSGNETRSIGENEDPDVTADEVDMWLNLFDSTAE